MSRARRQQYMLRTEASEQEAVITIYSQEIALKVIEEYVKLNQWDAMPIENNQVIKTMAEME